MNNTSKKLLLSFFLTIFSIVCLESIAQPTELCFPLGTSGITPCFTLNNDLKRLLGNGFFTENEGALGVYRWVNESKTLTLEISLGMNNFISEVRIINGIDLPASEQLNLQKYLSTYFKPSTRSDVMNFIGLSNERIEELIGKPSSILNEDGPIWIYEPVPNAKNCYEYSALILWFKDDKVEAVKITSDNT